ncbi:IS630 family transposase, partial [Actinopolymorpha pittospori]|uniref:IS630 family transposase n=1 Tax=Actinopolymorpha pittospori TaxID=648752 RepID=UPI0031E93319
LEATSAGHVQDLHRPGVRDESGRRRRPLPRSARGCDGAQLRREDAGPGSGPTQPLLPISFDKTEKRTHDYVRHGTTNLFAALEVLTGKITGQTFHRKRTKEFLRFMERLVKRYPAEQEIHVVLDNLKTHNNGDINEWLAKHPNVKFHFTPKGSSWINQIETWFGIITRQSI